MNPSNRSPMTLGSLLAVAGAIALFTGCAKAKDKTALPGESQSSSAEPRKIVTAVVAREDVSVPLKAMGSTVPLRDATLGAEVTARVDRVLVREGQRVKAGQTLVLLDPQSAKLRAAQARASAAAAQVQAQQADADYDRLAPLAERGSIVANRAEQARAQRDAARASSTAAKAAADTADRAVTMSALRAPFAGVVVSVPVDVGEIATMAPATTLVRLVDLSQLEVRVRVPERQLAGIAAGDPVVARFPSLDVQAKGTIDHVSVEIDPKTRTAEAVARIPNPDGRLRAGLFTVLEISPSKQRAGLVVPRSSVGGAGDDAYSYLVENGHAKRKPVKVEPIDDQRVEVMDGLKAGEVVVAADLDRIADGAPVTAEAAKETLR